MNYRQWGGNPPGHDPVRISPAKRPMGKWLANADKVIGVAGGFRAAVEWYGAKPDVDGKPIPSDHLCRILLDEFGLHVHPDQLKRARMQWRKDDQR